MSLFCESIVGNFCSFHAVIPQQMEQCALKNVNNCLNTDIYSYLVTPGG